MRVKNRIDFGKNAAGRLLRTMRYVEGQSVTCFLCHRSGQQWFMCERTTEVYCKRCNADKMYREACFGIRRDKGWIYLEHIHWKVDDVHYVNNDELKKEIEQRE